MLYALKNQNGEIVALTNAPTHANADSVNLDDPEVLNFLLGNAAQHDETGSKTVEFFVHDIQQIRILEDLIDLLTQKGIILFSELPVAAQEKIFLKKTIREGMGTSNIIVVDDIPLL